LDRLQQLLAADPLAPTAVRDPRRIIDDHLADSLVALELRQLTPALRVVDLGSGAGIPGLPLAIALPAASFVLVESSSRKCAFIARAAMACALRNVEAVHSRIESWGGLPASFDVALARAVAPPEVVLEYAAPLLTVGGRLVAWRGRRDAEAEERAAKVAHLLGLRLEEVRQVWPYPEARDRHLHLFLKVMDTPPEFPRRAGMARKRPLGRK
jgi:16S rRNA (guanine527-N7)-methyltransferase